MGDVRALGRIAGLLRASLGSRLIVLLLLAVASSLTAGASLVLLVPLLSLVGVDAAGGSTAALVTAVSRAFDAVGVQPTAAALLTLNALVLTFTAALQRAQSVLEQRYYQRFVTDLRVRVFDAMASANWRHLVGKRSSDHSHLLLNEIERVGAAAAGLVGLVSRALLALIHLAVAVYLSPLLTLIVLAAGALLIGATAPLSKRAKARGKAVSDAYRDLYGVVGDQLSGLKTLKAHGLEPESVDRFTSRSVATADAMVGLARQQAGVGFALQVGSAVALSAIVYVALRLESITPAALLTLLYLFARLVPMLIGLQRSFQGLVSQLPALDNTEKALAELEREREPTAAPQQLPEVREAIELQGVHFRYEGQDGLPVISGLSLSVPAGRTTAIVGPSGGGKSTLADLLIGLLEPDEGAILLDGVPLEPRQRRAWRRRVAYVAQDVFLFHDTVKANLLVAEPTAELAHLWRAIDLASAGFVRDLPEGLDTVVGDRGAKLSGGERQRLALARALLRHPDLLVLDEATSNLDAANEERVQQAIRSLHGHVTLVVIAHRLSTVREADVIHVMEGGRFVESGTWDELMANEAGAFRKLAEAQGLGPQATVMLSSR